jgi:nucleotide-binding universal stress UspA family protein
MKMRIVVATDGEPAAMGALRVARALAERNETPVEVVCAVPPFPVPPSYVGAPALLGLDELDATALDTARTRVRAQLEEVHPSAAAWPVTVTMGAPARTIVRLAEATGATLIVLGLGRHALADRWLGTETALRVVRLSHLPVLAVPAEAGALPDQAVCAVDFTEFSRDAADSTLGVMGPGGSLHLAHVLWKPTEEVPWVGGRGWIEVQRERTLAELDEMARRLDGTGGVNVVAKVLVGDAAAEILRFAGAVGAGLIAAGSHGTGFFGRLLMGSVSTRLLRGATCMVLIAPPRTRPAELQETAPAEQEQVPAAAP